MTLNYFKFGKKGKKLLLSLSLLAAISSANLPAYSANLLEEHQRFYTAGVKAEKNGEYQKALDNFTRALAMKSRDTATLVKLSSILIYQSTFIQGDKQQIALSDAIGYLDRANSVSPSDSMVQVLLAQAYTELGDYEQAIKKYEKAITLDPDNVLLRLNLGLAHFETKQYKESIENLNKVILAYPDNLKARSYLGAALQSTDNYLAAIEQYNYVLNFEKDNFSVIKNIGDCWLALDQLQRAKESYSKANEIDPKVPEVYADLAFIDQKQNNYDVAATNYQKALNLRDNQLWRKSLAYTLWANNDLQAAVDEFEKLGEDNVTAFILQTLGDKEKAIEKYKKAIEANPKDLRSRFNLAKIYHDDKSYELAKEQYVKIIEQKPNDVETIYLLGLAEQETGVITEAIAHYNELLEEHLTEDKPSSAIRQEIKQNIYFNLGIAYKLENELDKSEESFQKARESGFTPEADLYRELSTVKILLGKNKEAEKLLLSWLKENPTNVTARNLYADLLVNADKEREAIEQLKLASVLDKETTSRLKLANLLHKQENLYEALSEYQIILKAEPDNLDALLGAGNNYRSLGLNDEAVNIYSQAAVKYPEDLLANYNYGLALQEAKKTNDALLQYQKVMEINPSFYDNYYTLGLCYWDLEEKDKAIDVWNKFLRLSSNDSLKQEVVNIIHDYEVSHSKIRSTPDINGIMEDLDEDEDVQTNVPGVNLNRILIESNGTTT